MTADLVAQGWYALPADEVTAKLGVDPATGLSSAEAAARLAKNGPNALPAEKPPPGWRRFLGEYTSYMQLILLAAGVVSIVIGEVRTGIVLILLTLLNAVIGLKQKGKAESAMNALQANRSRPTGGSSRRARCRSTSPRSPARAFPPRRTPRPSPARTSTPPTRATWRS